MMYQLGLTVEGSDYSASMLEVAKRNLDRKGADIVLKQCDFRFLESKYNKKFDAVVCLTNALPHLHTDNDLVTALKSMHNCLNSGGILVLTSGTTPYTLAKTPPIEVVVNREDFSRVFIKENRDNFLTIHILDLYHSTNRMESNQYDIVNKILLDSDYERLLKQAGYSGIHIYGDYKMNQYYSDSSRRIIVVAEK
jgi:SAM-dependent methyltransferase